MLTDTPVMYLQFRRVLPSYKRDRSIRKGTVHNLVSWVNNKQQAEIARISWQDLSQSWIGESEEVRERFQSSKKNRRAAEVSVLYLVGDPIETAQGVRMRSASALYESLSFRGGDLLRVGEEVPQIFPNLEFCIIQAAPKERSQRTSRERIDAAYMRTFAAELFEAGVPAVVALPSLSMDITIRILRQFADALQNWNSRRSLFRAIEKAQSLLSEGSLEEQAYDLCLYADSEFE
jgi:hypothetical protein